MLRPNEAAERSEFSSQALLLIDSDPLFSQIPEWNKIPRHVSPSRTLQEILNIFRYFLIRVHFGKSEFSDNDTYQPPIGIVYNLLHGILEFHLALIINHSQFVPHAVHNKLFH